MLTLAQKNITEEINTKDYLSQKDKLAVANAMKTFKIHIHLAKLLISTKNKNEYKLLSNILDETDYQFTDQIIECDELEINLKYDKTYIKTFVEDLESYTPEKLYQLALEAYKKEINTNIENWSETKIQHKATELVCLGYML